MGQQQVKIDSIPVDGISRHVRDTEAAQILGLSVDTLRHMRTRRVGPPFRKFGGAVRYCISDLEKWAAAQTVE